MLWNELYGDVMLKEEKKTRTHTYTHGQCSPVPQNIKMCGFFCFWIKGTLHENRILIAT